MRLVIVLALAATMNGSDAAVSVRTDLVILTRNGCVHTPRMVKNLDGALRALGWARDYQTINTGKLSKTDNRVGYPTPTLLWKGKDIFGLPVPRPPFDAPT